eukprot:COSAG05_NODE_7712_length_777_cov_0.941003_2_plen_197_part_01
MLSVLQEYTEESLEKLDLEELQQWVTYRSPAYERSNASWGDHEKLLAVAVEIAQSDESQGPPPLPPDWGAEWSSQYSRYYFINCLTNDTQWEVPTAPARLRSVVCSNPGAVGDGSEAGDGDQAAHSGGIAGDDADAEDDVDLASLVPVDINDAPMERLCKALSLEMAEKIISERQANGPFTSSANACASSSGQSFHL